MRKLILATCGWWLLCNWQGVYAQQKKLNLPKKLELLTGHIDTVVAYDLSTDGTQLLTSAQDRTIRLWEAGTGRLLKTYQIDKSYARVLKFAPDGQSFLSCCFHREDKTMRWLLRAMKTGKVLKKLSLKQGSLDPPTPVVRFFEDGEGKKILSEDFFIDLQSWKIKKHSMDVGKSSSFSPDKNQLLTNSGGNVAILWDLKYQELICGFVGHTKQVTSVNYSPDGKQVLTGSADATLKLWDAKVSRLIRTFEGHNAPVEFATFAPNGRQIISFAGMHLFLWDVTSGQLIKKVFAKGFKTCQARFIQGKVRILLMGARNETGQIWEVSGNSIQLLQTLGFVNFQPEFIAFEQRKRQIWLRTSDTTLKVWDLSTLIAQPSPLKITPDIEDVRFSTDGTKVLISIPESRSRKNIDFGYAYYDLKTGKQLWATKKKDYYPNHFHGNYFSISANGQFCTLIHRGELEIRDAKTGKKRDVSRINGNTFRFESVDMSSENNLLTTTGTSSFGKIWNFKQQQIIDSIPGEEYSYLKIRIIPGDQMLLGWGGYKEIFFTWDLQQRKKKKGLKLSLDGWVGESILFSKDGKRMITREYGGLNIWDLKTCKKLQNLPVTQVAFFQYLANEQKLIVGDYHGTVQVWQLSNGRLLGILYLFQVDQKLEWVAITPENKYDGSKKGLTKLHYRLSNNSFKPLLANAKDRVHGLFQQLLK